jgi:hypothetical protein
MRIVHAANLQLDKDGAHLWNQDQKIHHGLVRLGHFVYPFSINDRARMLSPTGGKSFGKGRANKALVKSCLNVHPDLLLLGHAQFITAATLREIRRLLPAIRIGLWYVDAMWAPEKIRHLHERVAELDAVCVSTAGPWLEALAVGRCVAGYIPSAVDAGIECHRAYATPPDELLHDLLFFGSDQGDPGRRNFLTELCRRLEGLRVGLYGCLDRPGIFGWEKEEIIRRSKIALNLSRRTDVPLYSSSRIAELMGNGILTLSPRGAGFEELFAADELVQYDDFDDLVAKTRHFAAADAERTAIARRGRERNHRDYNGTEVARFIVALTMRDESWRQAPWSRHVYGAGRYP